MSNSQRRILYYGFLFIVLALVINLVEIETRMPVFFQGDSDDIAFKLADSLQSNQFSRRYIIAVSGGDENFSRTIVFSKKLIKQLEQREDISQIWFSNQPPINVESELVNYAQHAHQIFSLNPEQEGGELFDPDGLMLRAARLKQALLGSQRHLVKSVSIRDPLLLTFNAFKHWRDTLQNQTDNNTGDVHILLQSNPQAFDYNAQSQLQSAIDLIFTTLNQQSANRFQYQMTGIPVFAVAAQKEIKADVQKVTILSSVSVILVFLLLLRSFKALQWTALVLISAMAVGTLLTTLVFGSTHALTIALGATLIGVCVDYPIHTMVHSAANTLSDSSSVVRRIWPSLLLGGLTTMIGYCALAFTGYPGFQQIAVFALSGITTALVITRYILPALLETTKLRYPNLPVLVHWLDLCLRYRTSMRVVVVVLLIVAVSSFSRLQWLDDLEKLSGTSLQNLKQIDQSIRSQISTIEAGRLVLIEADSIETALQKSEQATLLLQTLRDQGAVEDFYPIYPWLVSKHLQHRNLQVYQRHINSEYQSSWQKELATQGLSVSKLGHLVDVNTAPMAPDQMLRSQVKQIIGSQIIQNSDQVLIVIWLGQHEPNQVAEAIQTLKGVSYISQRDSINEMAQRYRSTAVYALTIGLLIILILLLLRYRHLRVACITLFPALCAVIFILGFWCLLKQPISFLHLIGSLFAVAICVDYGIFYSENRSENRLHTYQAMAASMLTTVAAFASLSISSNPLLQTLSAAVTIGVVIGFLLCPILIESDNQVRHQAKY